MKCKVCGKKITFKSIVNHGFVCEDCYNALPKSLRDQFVSGKYSHIDKISPIFFANLGSPLFGFSRLNFYKSGIGIDGWTIDLEHIKDFHVFCKINEWLSGQKCRCMFFAKITTKNPEVTVEESILDLPVILDYHTRNGGFEVTFPRIFKAVIEAVKTAIQNDYTDLLWAKEKFDQLMAIEEERKRREEEERLRREEEHKRREEEERLRREEERKRREEEERLRREEERKRREEEERLRREEERKRREEERKHREQNTYQRSSSRCESEFEANNHHFQMRFPFTGKDLSKRRKELMHQYHPDMGGTNEMATCINKEYDVLKHYAS